MSEKCMIRGPKSIGAALQEWHSGAGDAIYVVGSHWYAGHAVECKYVEAAVDVLRRHLRAHSVLKGRRKVTSEGRARSAKYRRELNTLIRALTTRLYASR